MNNTESIGKSILKFLKEDGTFEEIANVSYVDLKAEDFNIENLGVQEQSFSFSMKPSKYLKKLFYDSVRYRRARKGNRYLFYKTRRQLWIYIYYYLIPQLTNNSANYLELSFKGTSGLGDWGIALNWEY